VGYADLADFFDSLEPAAAVVVSDSADTEAAASAAQWAGAGRRLIHIRGSDGPAGVDEAALRAIEARLCGPGE